MEHFQLHLHDQVYFSFPSEQINNRMTDTQCVLNGNLWCMIDMLIEMTLKTN